MTNIWWLSPWREELPPNTLFDEISALEEVYVHLQGDSSLDKWTYFFKKEPAPSLLKLFQYCASIPISNANVERIFSVVGNLWTDEHLLTIRYEMAPCDSLSKISFYLFDRKKEQFKKLPSTPQGTSSKNVLLKSKPTMKMSIY
ncbi:leucine-rich repeat-containing protein 3B isoform X3 [Pantherophis guttatus]|nr:leucine-rich repeat-containing protein 3B isoform X3 [Pantherophis guttatus]